MSNAVVQICPLCGSSKLRPSKVWPGHVVVCRDCSSGFSASLDDSDPGVADAANREAFETFFASPSDRTLSRLKNRALLSALTSLPAGASVLEIGPGSGEFLAALRKEGFRVRGADISARICDDVRTRLEIEMHQGTLEDIEGTGIVAAMAAHHVLEHVLAPARFLREAHRLLDDGGLLLLSVPNIKAWSAFLRGWGGYQPYHLYYFTPRSVQDLLRDSGFDVLRAWTRDPHGSTLDSIYRSMFHRVLPFSAAPEFRPGKPPNGARWTSVQMLRVVLAYAMLPLSWLARALGRGDEVVVARARRIDCERAESGFQP